MVAARGQTAASELHQRTKVLRAGLAAHWDLSHQLDAHCTHARDSLHALRLLGHGGGEHQEQARASNLGHARAATWCSKRGQATSNGDPGQPSGDLSSRIARRVLGFSVIWLVG